MLICFSSAYWHWASSVHFFGIVAGRLGRASVRLDSPWLEISAEQALPGWAAAWQEASSSRNRDRGRFQSPLPETERHPFLTLTTSLFRKSLPRFPAGKQGQEKSCQLSGKLLRRIKIKTFPDLICLPSIYSVISMFRDYQMKVVK